MSAPERNPMPINWDGMPVGVRISIVGLDDVGLPVLKRGTQLRIPDRKEGFNAFADKIGLLARDTVLTILDESAFGAGYEDDKE